MKSTHLLFTGARRRLFVGLAALMIVGGAFGVLPPAIAADVVGVPDPPLPAQPDLLAPDARTKEQHNSADRILAVRKAIAKDPSSTNLKEQLAGLLVDARDYVGAVKQYSALLAIQPDDSATIFNRGVAYHLQGDDVKAAADLAAYAKLKPTDPMGWTTLGVFLGRAGDWKGSAAAFTRVIALKPDDLDACKNRGIDEYNLHDYPAAAADLTKYDAAKPGDVGVEMIIDHVKFGHSDIYSGTVPMLEAQSRTHPNDADVWFNLGIAYQGTKNYVKAVKAFTRSNVIRRDPQTLFNRALAYSNLGQIGNAAAYAKAAVDAGAALALKPDYADARLVKADAEYAEKKPALAAADYWMYLSMPGISDEGKTYASKRVLQSYIDSKDMRGVIKATTAVIAANPDDPPNYLIRGTAYISVSEYDSAILDLTKYTAMRPDDPYGFCDLGAAFQGKRDFATAIVDFQKAVVLKPDYYAAVNSEAFAYQSWAAADQDPNDKTLAQYDKAVALFDQAASMKTATPKQNSDALYSEALALEAKAKAADEIALLKPAVAAWEKWIAVAPNDPRLPKVRAHVERLNRTIAYDG